MRRHSVRMSDDADTRISSNIDLAILRHSGKHVELDQALKFALQFQEQELTFHVDLLGVDQVLTSEISWISCENSWI